MKSYKCKSCEYLCMSVVTRVFYLVRIMEQKLSITKCKKYVLEKGCKNELNFPSCWILVSVRPILHEFLVFETTHNVRE